MHPAFPACILQHRNSLTPKEMMIRWLILLWMTLTYTYAFAQQAPRSPRELRKQIEAILQEEPFQNAFWGIVVYDLHANKTLYTHNPEKSFIPASNLKLYTTAAALDILKPSFQYKTPVYVYTDSTATGLKHHLIVRGSGDPTIGGRFTNGDRTRTFRDWADSLKAAGIHLLEGDVVGDDDIFDDIPLGYGWSWDDETYWYSAELGGLVFNDNCVDFTIVGLRRGTPALVSWEPFNTDYVRVINATLTLPPDSSLTEGYTRERGSNTIYLSSRIPEGRIDFESLTVHNPTLYFAHILRSTLIYAGIPVFGLPVDVDDLPIKPDYSQPAYRKIATHYSPPLREIVKVINKRSQNLYADQLLKTLGAVAYPDSLPGAGSHARGIAVAMQVFARAGIDTSRIQMVDGSGLSRMNLVTPEMTVKLLRYMWQHPDTTIRNAFYESLPIGGIDGTLEKRFRQGKAYTNVRAKTGYVSNARTLSGYVHTARGTPLAFSIMCNHYTIPTKLVNQAQDRIVELLARYRR